MDTDQNTNPHKQHVLLKLLFSAAALISWIVYRHMPQEERDKVSQVLSLRMHHATRAIIDYVLPHARNNYQPKVFQARSVKHIVLIVVLVKVALISTLFALYPNLGKLEADIRSQMYALTNQYRLDKGVHQLSINSYLEQAAAAKGNDMLAQNYFSHYGPDGKKPWQWLDPAKYDFSAMGENLGMDFLTAGSVFKAFQQSPTHDKNLLNSAYNEIGIATLSGYLDGHTTNLIVVFFGTRKGATTQVAVAPTTAAPVQPTVTPTPTPAPVPKPVVNPVPTQNTNVAPQPKPAPLIEQPTLTPTQPVQIIQPQPSPIPVPTDVAADQLAYLQPQIEVLGEAVSNDQGQVVEHFEPGVVFSKGTWLQRTIAWSNRFLFIFLLTLVLLLGVNIVVKFRVQHAHIILNAVFLIVVVTGALYLQVHAAEAIGEHIRILGSMFVR